MIAAQARTEMTGLLPSTKFLLLAAYLALDCGAVSQRMATLGLSLELAAFVVIFGALALALCAAALIPTLALRITFAVVLACASAALHSYEWSTGSPLVYEAFETMLASHGDVGDAIAEHGRVMLQAIGLGLLLLIGIALPPRRLALPFGLGWIVPASAVVALAALLYLRGGEGARALPAPFSPLANGTILVTLRLIEDNPTRQPVRLTPGAKRAAGDVVLVIDESVAANYLDINHPQGVHSGLKEARNGVSLANFGVAASVSNCSVGSNLTLRFGGTRKTYRQALEEMPSIWAYARAAGLRTVYLDGQRVGGQLQNGMTPSERAEIDEFRQLGDTAVSNRDHELARLLGERLINGVSEFILVNKVGAHFPVAAKFPLSAAVYRPLPIRSGSEGITDIASLPGVVRETDEDWRRYRNAYRNTVAWSTGRFFDRLLPNVPGTGAVIIYTSDHGQDLHERGGAGGSTHCSHDPRAEEGAVPLVFIAAEHQSAWLAHAKANFDRMSHFRVFPSLLALMGYAPEQAESFYGSTLTSRAGDPLTFTPTYHASLGRDPAWKRVAHSELSAPPVSDFLLAPGVP